MYDIEVRHLAVLEIIEAFDWYEAQRYGLGTAFLNDLDKFYESLYQNPFTYSYYDKSIRQGNLSRFPFLVVYEIFNDILVIYSVFMYRQHPDKKRTK